MFIDIDDPKLEVTGFCYKDKNGKQEVVKLENATAVIINSINNKTSIFYEDIPKLIKALQAAYDHKKGSK